MPEKRKYSLSEVLLKSMQVYVEVDYKFRDDTDKLIKAMDKVFQALKEKGLETTINTINGAFSKETSFTVACFVGELMGHIGRETNQPMDSTTMVLPERGFEQAWLFFFSQAFKNKNNLIVFHEDDFEKVDVADMLVGIEKKVPSDFFGAVVIKNR